MIQLADVQVFLEIVGGGSFTAAARALKTPKSSVGRQVARLEQAVGCALLDRSTRVVVLTEEGRSFLPHARRLLDDAIEAQNVLRARGKGASGLLTIAATGLIGRRFVVPHLPAFRARNPNLRIALWLGPERLGIGPGEGEADVAIRLRTTASAAFGVQKLGEIAFRIVASPDYLARCGEPGAPEDLADHAIIELGPAGKPHRLQLHGRARTANVAYAPPIHIDDPESVRIAAIAGCGIAVLPEFLVREDVRTGVLRAILDGWRQAPAPLNALYRAQVAPPLRVRAYLDHLRETLAEARPWGDET